MLSWWAAGRASSSDRSSSCSGTSTRAFTERGSECPAREHIANTAVSRQSVALMVQQAEHRAVQALAAEPVHPIAQVPLPIASIPDSPAHLPAIDRGTLSAGYFTSGRSSRPQTAAHVIDADHCRRTVLWRALSCAALLRPPRTRYPRAASPS